MFGPPRRAERIKVGATLDYGLRDCHSTVRHTPREPSRQPGQALLGAEIVVGLFLNGLYDAMLRVLSGARVKSAATRPSIFMSQLLPSCCVVYINVNVDLYVCLALCVCVRV